MTPAKVSEALELKTDSAQINNKEVGGLQRPAGGEQKKKTLNKPTQPIDRSGLQTHWAAICSQQDIKVIENPEQKRREDDMLTDEQIEEKLQELWQDITTLEGAEGPGWIKRLKKFLQRESRIDTLLQEWRMLPTKLNPKTKQPLRWQDD